MGQLGQYLDLDPICIFTIFGFVANLRDLLSLLNLPVRANFYPMTGLSQRYYYYDDDDDDLLTDLLIRRF